MDEYSSNRFRDGPWDYSHQPGNVVAWRIGECARRTMINPGGDLIDTGLNLLKELELKGFGIYPIQSSTIATRSQEDAK